jgi:hypothetical protein
MVLIYGDEDLMCGLSGMYDDRKKGGASFPSPLSEGLV